MFWRKRKFDDFSSEIESHLALEIERLQQEQGLSYDEARATAYRAFGNVTKTQERFYESGRWLWIDHLWQDIRFALRMLRKSPGFTTIAVLTLALGIGANTAIFSAVNGLLLEPLPYADPSRLVTITALESLPTPGVMATIGLSANLWTQVFADQTEFESTALYSTGQYTLATSNGPERVSGAEVSGNFFSLLGTEPLLGRPILASDTRPVQARVVVLGYALWKDVFGGDSSIIGREITVDGAPYRVIGVMCAEVEFGAGAKGLWVPAARDSTLGRSAIARLKANANINQADAQLKVAASRIDAKYPKITILKGWQLHATRMTRDTGQVGSALFILMGAVGFVLLIACVNISALLLARGWSRQREVAMREALGATRLRLIRQFLTESLTISAVGGVLGMIFSIWAIRGLRAIVPPGTPHTELLRIDPAVLGFTAGISLLAGVLFGLAPALQGSVRQIGTGLKNGTGGSAARGMSRHPRVARNALLVIETALAVVLVIGATLAARSLQKMLSIDLGFRRNHIVTLTVHFSNSVCDRTDEAKAAQCHLSTGAILDRIRGLPGVEDAAAVSSLPLDGSAVFSLRINGTQKEVGVEHGTLVFFRDVTPGYFRALGIPVLAGRSFGAGDAEGAQRVAVVNEAFARQFLDGKPLGREISLSTPSQKLKGKNGGPVWMEIVGEVRASDDINLDPDTIAMPAAEFYVPFGQADFFNDFSGGGRFILRTVEDPIKTIPAVERRIWSVDKGAPVTDVKTVDQIVAENATESRFQTLLLSTFGALGLLLAAVGMYGMISYAVAQRTHEIGVRMALGSQRGDVLRMVIGEGAVLAGIGIAVGVGGAVGLTRFLRSLLFEVSPTDPATFVAVAVALFVVAVLACYVPARRAMGVDPITALRHE